MPDEERSSLEFETHTLVYEAVQRCFRNAVVDHLRQYLRAANPAGWKDDLRKPFKVDEWNAIESSITQIKASKALDIKHEDDFDLLGVNHFYNLFDCHFASLIPPEELPPKEYHSRVRTQLLAWLREIKAVRDPVSHPPAQDMRIADALRTVDSAIRVVDLLHRSKDALRLREIYRLLIERAAAGASPEILSSIDDTLPPREQVVEDFVGREAELERLWSWLADSDSRRWVLCGDGGKGKTAIAYKFAYDVKLAGPTPICAVFWLSAKRRQYIEGQIRPISSPDFFDLDSALNKILSDYGFTEEVHQSSSAKKVTALGLLDEFPALIVVDDLDSIPPEEEAVTEFFTFDAARTRSKILITSRRQIMGMGRTSTIVKGLPEDDAREFLVIKASAMGLDQTSLTERRCRQISQLCEGSPLYMEDFLRLTKFLPFGEAYETWSSRANQSVRKYALQREIEMLSPLAKDVLQTCSLARAALTLVELQRVLGVHPDAILSAVDELTRLYLVPAPQLVEGIPRFHVNSNLAALVRDSISGSTRALELQNALRAVSGEALGRDDLVRDYCRQARVLSDASRHEDARRTMESALEKFPNHPRLLGVLGWVYRRWQPPKVVDARAAWQRAYELGSKARSTYVHWIGLESDEGDWHRAATAADKGLERCGEEDSLLLRTAGYAYTRYGRSLRNNLDEARAKSAFDKADHLLSTAVRRAHFEHASTDDLARTYRAWVHNADARRDQEAVCYRLGRWLDWNRRSPFLLEEARRHASLCPDIASSLEQEGRT